MKTTSMILREIKISEVLLFCGATVAILWSVYFSLVTISIPYQIEYREGASQVLTDFLLHGENPFVLDSQPLTMNNYGFAYSMVVYPFAVLFGNTLAVSRSVTFVFICLSGILGFVVVYKKTQSYSRAQVCTAFIVIGLISYGGVGAFPSSLGSFLFLLALLFPFLRSFDRLGLLLSFLASLVAFYTKPYFVLSFGIVSSYLFFFVSKKKGLLYGTSFLTVLLSSLLIVSRLFPLYFINIFIGNVSNANLIVGHLLDQLKVLFLSFFPVLFLAIVMFSFRFFKGRNQFDVDNGLLDISKLGHPFLRHSFNFLFYSFLCSLLVFVFILGPHKGNYLNYAFQLLVPTFFCWFFVEFIFWTRLKIFLIFIVLINLFAWEYDVLNPVMLEQKDSEQWARVYEYLDSSSSTLNSPILVSEILALGQIPVDSGQTLYFYEVKPFSKSPLNRIDYADFYEDGFLYIKSIDQMIKTKKYDLVVTKKGGGGFYHFKLLPDYYYQVDEVRVDMPQTGQSWTVVLWKPKER